MKKLLLLLLILPLAFVACSDDDDDNADYTDKIVGTWYIKSVTLKSVVKNDNAAGDLKKMIENEYGNEAELVEKDQLTFGADNSVIQNDVDNTPRVGTYKLSGNKLTIKLPVDAEEDLTAIEQVMTISFDNGELTIVADITKGVQDEFQTEAEELGATIESVIQHRVYSKDKGEENNEDNEDVENKSIVGTWSYLKESAKATTKNDINNKLAKALEDLYFDDEISETKHLRIFNADGTYIEKDENEPEAEWVKGTYTLVGNVVTIKYANESSEDDVYTFGFEKGLLGLMYDNTETAKMDYKTGGLNGYLAEGESFGDATIEKVIALLHFTKE